MQPYFNYKHQLFIIVIVIFLSGCRLGKEYQRPALDLPERFAGVSYADTSSIADIGWQNFFPDTTLQRLIATGIGNNHDLLAAVKRIEMAQLQVKQSRLLQMPTVDLGAAVQINRPSDNSLNGLSIKNFLGRSYIENYNLAATVSWEADIWGKIRGQKELVLTQYLQTSEAAKGIQTSLVAGIADGYFNLLMLDRQLAITRKNLLLMDSFVVVTRLLNDAGLGNALAVQQAEVLKRSTGLLIPHLEQQIAIQENELQLLTGQLPGSIRRTASFENIPLGDDLPTGIPVAMVSRRPDVRASELSLVAANAEIGITQANMYPGLNLTAAAGLESFKSGNWLNIPNSLFGLAAGSIVQPVFRRKELKTQFEIAKLRREEAVIRFRQSVLTAVGEVSNALVQWDKLKEQEGAAHEQVNTLHRAIATAQLLFRSDMATYLEVITVQANALEAELNLALIQRQRLAARVELYRSLGGGWK